MKKWRKILFSVQISERLLNVSSPIRLNCSAAAIETFYDVTFQFLTGTISQEEKKSYIRSSYFFFYQNEFGSLACSHSELIVKLLILYSWQAYLDGRSARRKAATYAGRHEHRINAEIHASSRIRNHVPNVWVGKVISCLRSWSA
jgi:hypothetical protein